jgi:pimeloyl-ACP methyl ester carboxylesterase
MSFPVNRNKTLLLLLTGVLLFVGWQLLRDQFSEEEKAVRSTVREYVNEQYPEEANAAAATYGLTPSPDNAQADREKTPVILIHGLDDPGLVWMNLAPALHAEAYPVWIFNYPNDQPITESARLFGESLSQLHLQGVDRVNLVAHSMGGLVSREMLTNPDIIERLQLPMVRKLIMVGTPNHGSELARFRLLAEVRDQLINLFSEDFNWLNSIFDGAGEAGIDLVPGSRFLTELNNRPNPPGTELIVIAAALGQHEIDTFKSRLPAIQDRLPENSREAVSKFFSFVEKRAHELGDGLVPVTSARLEGAEFHLVEGNHQSMIRNILESSDRVPPAFPIIFDHLNMKVVTKRD